MNEVMNIFKRVIVLWVSKQLDNILFKPLTGLIMVLVHPFTYLFLESRVIYASVNSAFIVILKASDRVEKFIFVHRLNYTTIGAGD